MADVYLRPLAVEDSAISYKWRNDAELWEYTGSRPKTFITLEMEREWATKVLNDPTRANYAICTVDNRYIGNTYLIHLRDRLGELGIFIGEKDCHGRGLGTLALEELKKKAKQDLGLVAILINVDEKNGSALRMYEKCGAKRISDIRPLPVGRFWMRIDL